MTLRAFLDHNFIYNFLILCILLYIFNTGMKKLIILILLAVFSRQWCYLTSIGDSARINQVDWSPNDNLIASASDSHRAVIYNSITLDPVCISQQSSDIRTIKFSKDGTKFAIGYQNDNVKIFSTTPPCAQITSFDSDHNTVVQLDFSADDTQLVTCGTDDRLRVWNLNNNPPTQTMDKDIDQNIQSCKFSDIGVVGVSDDDGKVYVYYTNGSKKREYSVDEVLKIDFRPGTDTVVGADKDKKLRIMKSGSTTSKSVSPSQQLYAIDYAKDSSILTVGGKDGRIYFYNTTNEVNTFMTTIRRSGSKINSLVLSPSTSYLLAGRQDGNIDLYKRFCNNCPVGYYQGHIRCELCTIPLLGCDLCRNATHCYHCMSGYYLDTTNFCQPCTLTGCLQCSSVSVCTQCGPEYYLNGNSCDECKSVMTGCQACVNSTICQKCLLQYQLNSGACLSCQPNCLICNDTTCLQCVSGYYDSSGNCLVCPQDNCLLCNSSQCLNCIGSYYLVSGLCQKCLDNCLNCNNSGYCMDCKLGTYDSGGLCLYCDHPCFSCETTATNCRSCNVGYYYSSAGVCSKCVNCPLCDSSGSCLSCYEGYYFSAGLCDLCSNLYSNCLLCESLGCNVCSFNYELTPSLTCALITAVQNCLVYGMNSTSCQTCNIGFYINYNACYQCEQGCSRCQNGTVCLDCLPQFYLNAQRCLLCPPNCQTCQSDTVCVLCSPSTYLTSSNECKGCEEQIPFCSTCSDSRCTSCHIGYYLSSTNTSCIMCASPCSSCDISQCLICELGYYLDAGVCSRCSIGCDECESASNCSVCSIGYVFDVGVCVRCYQVHDNCQYCNQTSCLQCMPSYQLSSSSVCERCVQNCEVCEGGLCVKCGYGYYPSYNNLTCQKCQQKCVNCISQLLCEQCISGYYASDNGTCESCAYGCESCYNATTCDICFPQFANNNYVCEHCHDHIAGCQYCSATNVCEACLVGSYLLSPSTCQLCSTSMQGCRVCASSSECLSCDFGYYLWNSQCALCSNMTGCQQCNESVCLSCEWGYYEDNGVCKQCSSNVSSCASCSTQNGCEQCLSGFYVYNGGCEMCTQTYEGCIFCNVSTCFQCQGGYYLQNNQCNNCSILGCQVCNSSGTCLQCDTHYYKYDDDACRLCSYALQGCLQCTDDSTCVVCDTGYYNNNNTCQLCQALFPSCDICSYTQCHSCQTNFFLNNSQCSSCSQILQGCSACLNQNICMNCQAGYFLQSTQCHSCSTITGCLICLDSSACVYCTQKYYIKNDVCHSCSDSIPNCLNCVSESVCSLCEGNYQLSSGSCSQFTAQKPKQYPQIKVTTIQINTTHLQHTLYAVNSQFVQIQQNWTTDVQITIVNTLDQTQIALQILQVKWGDNPYSLIFITDNPVPSTVDSMTITRRRLLSSFSLDYEVQLSIKQSTINQIYPTFPINTDLLVDYPLSQPQFYKSLIQSKQYYYFFFGLSILILILTIYILKLCFIVPKTHNQGLIIPHFMAFKTGSFAIYPLFPQYLNYCYGFSIPDLPFLNESLSQTLSDLSQYTPKPYLLSYATLSIASTYLLPFLVYGALFAIIFIVRKYKNYQKLLKYEKLLYQWWVFGLAFSSACCLQGIVYNPIDQVSVFSIFYIIGVSIYLVLLLNSIYSVYQDKRQSYKIRVLIKASLLSLLHIAPLYVFSAFFIIDAGFIIYHLNLYSTFIPNPKLFMAQQFLLLIGLGCIIFLPHIFLGMILTSILIFISLILDIYINFRQYRQHQQIKGEKISNLQTFSIDEKSQEVNNMKSEPLFFQNQSFDEFKKMPSTRRSKLQKITEQMTQENNGYNV